MERRSAFNQFWHQSSKSHPSRRPRNLLPDQRDLCRGSQKVVQPLRLDVSSQKRRCTRQGSRAANRGRLQASCGKDDYLHSGNRSCVESRRDWTPRSPRRFRRKRSLNSIVDSHHTFLFIDSLSCKSPMTFRYVEASLNRGFFVTKLYCIGARSVNGYSWAATMGAAHKYATCSIDA